MHNKGLDRVGPNVQDLLTCYGATKSVCPDLPRDSVPCVSACESAGGGSELQVSRCCSMGGTQEWNVGGPGANQATNPQGGDRTRVGKGKNVYRSVKNRRTSLEGNPLQGPSHEPIKPHGKQPASRKREEVHNRLRCALFMAIQLN